MNINQDTLKKYKITILAHDYFLVSDEPAKHINEISNLVESQVNLIIEKNPEIDAKSAITLVSLKLASQVLKAKEKIYEQENKSDNLISLINTEIENF